MGKLARHRSTNSPPPTTTLHRTRSTPQSSGTNQKLFPSNLINLQTSTIMYRQALSKAVRPALRSSLQSRAAFSTPPRAMAGGDTGAPRSTGSGDAFTKREKANEDYAIRMRVKEKLMELKKKLAEQHEHLKKLEDHINEISKGQGGEQN